MDALQPLSAVPGILLFLAPGLVWSFVAWPGASLASRLLVGLALSFTLTPAVVLALNLVFGVPLVGVTAGVVAVVVAGWGAFSRLDSLWSTIADAP